MPREAPAAGPTRRRQAAAVAGHRGDPTTVRTFLADPDPGVRATALGALLRARNLLEADLRAGLADPHPTVRSRVAELVADLRGGSAATNVALLPLLSDGDPTVVEVAAWACGERDPAEPGTVARLATLATEADDALIRESAVAALGSLGDEAGLAAILTATQDKATVRRRAIIALAPFDGPEVHAALHRALTDRDWQVRQAAEDLADPADPGPERAD